MEELLLKRLLMLTNEIKRNSDLSLTLDLRNNEEISKAQVIRSKLKALLGRLNDDLNNYFRLVNNPPADDISQISEIQLEAEQNLAELEAKIEMFNKTKSNPVMETIGSRLPKLNLPEFDGDVLGWYQFWDQFSSNIDSRNIAEVDKLLYLKASVKGEAKKAIDGLETTNKNYQIALKTLRERYGNNSHLIDAHYAALSRVKPADKTISACRKTLNDLERHLRVLESLKEDVNHSHLRHQIFEKFPEDLIYELKLKTTNNSINEIRKHLEMIITAREDASRITNDKRSDTEYTVETLHTMQNESRQRMVSTRKRRSYREEGLKNRNTTSTLNQVNDVSRKGYMNKRKEYPRKPTESIDKKRRKLPCIFCNEDHYNDQCEKYKTAKERKLKLRNRCYECLREGHNISTCKLTRVCVYCKEKGVHNRALCPIRYPNRDSTRPHEN